MNDKIYIVAGHVSEYTYWVKKNIVRYYIKNTSMSLSNFVYVSGPEVFRGLSEVHGYFVGSYKNRGDLGKIKSMIEIINKLPYGSLGVDK